MRAVQLGPTTRVLVTGASRGIGAATAAAFVARGCTVGRVARSGTIEGPACSSADAATS
jgi:NAD(P)-dependent dehydrogenase (short-subunit alcohol dehydrogenase family)